jgi:pantoate--beta-alanine ligase
MKVVRDRASLRAARAELAGPVGFVPTMGALHRGHESLLQAARAECRSVVASIFVNPTQFGPGEDFTRYPRDEAADLAMLEAAGLDVAFLPSVNDIYPARASTSVDVGRLGEVLEGAHRPGHFRGVATVVTVLLSLVGADRAYFGQKDGQQVVVVNRMVRDLGLPVEIVVCPTVREPDGVALSSRNRYLSPVEREAASVLRRSLSEALTMYGSGERNADHLREAMRKVLAAEPLAKPDYVSIADAETLEEVRSMDGPALVSLAVRIGATRLIDCLPLEDPAAAGLG